MTGLFSHFPIALSKKSLNYIRRLNKLPRWFSSSYTDSATTLSKVRLCIGTVDYCDNSFSSFCSSNQGKLYQHTTVSGIQALRGLNELITLEQGVGGGRHRCELPGNYPVFTVVMVIFTSVRRIMHYYFTPQYSPGSN